jgi:homoserine kinase type II
MSVYTLIQSPDLAPLLQAYGLGDVVALVPIQGGIENSNYFLTVQAPDGPRELVLTLFEELAPEDAAFLPPLLAHLHQAGVPVAAPLATRDGRYQPGFRGKAVQIAPRLRGRHVEAPAAVECEAMGRTLAALHRALGGYELHRANAHGAGWWHEVAARWRPQLPEMDAELLGLTLADFDQLTQRMGELPRGLIHGDLFRDNTLFDGNTVSGVLDFSEAAEDYLLLDIAITMNDFCRAWPGIGLRLTSARAFIAGYESLRALTPDEREAMPIFLAIAAMRFWLSRLDINARNQAEGRQGEHVLEKDPKEMRDMMRDRLGSTMS